MWFSAPRFMSNAREWTGAQQGGFIALVGGFSVAAPLEGLKSRLISGTERL